MCKYSWIVVLLNINVIASWNNIIISWFGYIRFDCENIEQLIHRTKLLEKKVMSVLNSITTLAF